MTVDPLFILGVAIAICGMALGLFIIRLTARWIDKPVVTPE